jgi:hypothetical protein
MMSVDPVDDCTFWYTQEYYATVGVAPWQTRIGSFKLSDCGPVDNPPSVSIVDPVEGQTIASTYRVLVSASDDSAVTVVELSIDGGAYTDITANFDGTYYYYDWDTTGYPDGAHTLQARATDDAAQTTDSTIVNVTVDNVDDPPTVTITNPAEGATVSGSVDVTADASDDRGVAQVEFFVDGGSIGVDTDGTDGWSASWDTTAYADGSHTVSATATDTGAQTASDSVTVTVDNAGGITLTATGYKYRGLQKADLEWSGATSTNVDVYRDGALLTTTANDGFYTDNIDQRGGGSYTYQVCEAGTSTCSNEATVTF